MEDTIVILGFRRRTARFCSENAQAP